MAITRLTDFITVATNKWTYGDSAFKYEGEVNQDHDTIYPLMVMTPPTSRMPDIYEGWEHYNVEMEFYNTYQTAAQNAITLQQRWDNLQDLALEWLDNVLINYSGGVLVNPSTSSPTPTQVYIDKDTLQIDRIKNDKNDKLCRITMSFDMRMFTRCFTPKSIYPNTISNLTSWLRADSDVVFNIPTKKVSVLGDVSVNSNGAAQSTSSLQPLRYGYDGALDKTMFTFKNNSLISDNNFITDGTSAEEFTIFEVSKIDVVSSSVFGYYHLTDGSSIEMGTNAAGEYKVSVSDGTTELTQKTTLSVTGKYHIASLRKQNRSVWFDYYDDVNSHSLTYYNAAFTLPTSFENEKFRIGCNQESDGLIPPAAINTRYLDGGFQEMIMYNKKLTNDEVSQVVTYLNNKYKIY